MVYDSKDIMERYESAAQECMEPMREQHKQMYIDQLFLNGKYTALLEIGADENKPLVNINHIKPIIDAVCGFFRQQRRNVSYNAIGDEANLRAYSETMNKAKDQLFSNANMSFVESEQDRHMLSVGVGFLDTYVSRLSNPKGSIKAEAPNPRHIKFDPNAEGCNLLDANYIIRTRPMTAHNAMKLFPETDMGDFQLYDYERHEHYDERDKALPTYVKNSEKATPRNYGDVVAVDEMHWREVEKVFIYQNPAYLIAQTEPNKAQFVQQSLFQLRDTIQGYIDSSELYADGFMTDFDPRFEQLVVPARFKDDVESIIGQFVQPEGHDEQRWCYYSSVIGNKLLRSHKSIDQSGLQIKAKTGFFDQEDRNWFGMVRQQREPAMYVNKIMTDKMLILASRTKNLNIVREGIDVVEFEEQAARPGGVFQTADPAGDVVQMTSQSGTGYEGFDAEMLQMIAKSVGLNMEFLGQSPNRQVSGILENQRINQVQSILAPYADSISLCQKELGRSMLSYIRFLTDINDEFSISVAGNDGQQELLTLTREVTDIDYAVELGEAPINSVQKYAVAEMLQNIAQQVASVTGNVAPYTVALDHLESIGIEASTAHKMKEALQPQPTPEQQQAAAQQQKFSAQQAMLQMDKMAAEIEKIRSDIMMKQADVQKTGAETGKTLVETERERVGTDILMNKPLMEINASA